MSSKKNELDLILKNLRKGLVICTAKELNSAILMTISNKINNRDKNPEINFVLAEVAKEYSISERTLFRSSGRGLIKEARKICAWLLHYDLKLSQRHIAIRILECKYHNQISSSIREFKSLKDTIKTDRECKQKYESLQLRLAEFINNAREHEII